MLSATFSAASAISNGRTGAAVAALAKPIVRGALRL